ncbi:MAG: endonuclease MutS2 [Dehalococcoidia bacterium]|nr:endonuclease MutS2 [Dehalococcoidia bacterium]
MDTKSLELLEFARAKGKVADFASFELSRDEILELQPFTDRTAILERLAESSEASLLLALDADFTTGVVTDVRPAASLAAQGMVLQPGDLLEAAHTLLTVSDTRRRLEHHSVRLPRLWSIAGTLSDLGKVAAEISSGIGPSGEILDSASPRLMEIRQSIISVRQTLVANLEEYLATTAGQRIVSDTVVTQREGRYVIPVKAEFRHELGGIVHDVSNSGATVFLEPWSTVEQGNELRQLEVGERHEIERILGDRSRLLGAHRDAIGNDIETMTTLDVALAKARYAERNKAVPAIVLDDSGARTGGASRLVLNQARHPLLGSGAVPLSLKMGDQYDVLVVTGPNTGGKTVLLKTVGLMAAMTQAGIPIPAAEGTALPVFDGIYADIGDEQSIEATLSTFSWHLTNAVRIVENATAHSLVLLDEPGASTDPAEGSALARALLEHFLSRGTLTIAATHYTDVKVYAHATTGVENASFEFDAVTKRPTYHLNIGFPAGSNALATAARLGLPEELVERARKMLPKADRDLAVLLTDLEKERESLEETRKKVEAAQANLEQRQRELDEELARARDADRQAIQRARDDVTREAAMLYREIREASAELKRQRSKEQVERARRTLGVVQEKLVTPEMQVPRAEETPEQPPEDPEIRVGDTVRIRGTTTDARVLSISEKTFQLEVQCGQTKLWLGVDSVDKVAGGSRASAPKTSTVSIRSRWMDREVPREMDLRGRRADEIEPELDTYFNAASMARVTDVRIIHGFGTGTVRNIVREYVKASRLVKSFRPGEKGEGGDGVTVVEFAD